MISDKSIVEILKQEKRCANREPSGEDVHDLQHRAVRKEKSLTELTET
jgi:hypothetical protein